MTAPERLIATAEEQVGYQGKQSDDHLDDFTAGAPGLYNKYARDLDELGDFYNGPKNGYDWCDVFVDWCFVHTFGRETAQKLLCQPDRSLGAGVGWSMNYYAQEGRLFASPQPGDQVFFGDADSTWHTGIVTRVCGGCFHTVEGNAGSPSAVRACEYALTDPHVKGCGRPDWSLVKEDDEMLTYEQWRDYMDRYRRELAGLSVSAWAEEELAEAARVGITDGKRPRDLVTREEAAVMALRSRD